MYSLLFYNCLKENEKQSFTFWLNGSKLFLLIYISKQEKSPCPGSSDCSSACSQCEVDLWVLFSADSLRPASRLSARALSQPSQDQGDTNQQRLPDLQKWLWRFNKETFFNLPLTEHVGDFLCVIFLLIFKFPKSKSYSTLSQLKLSRPGALFFSSGQFTWFLTYWN